MNGVCRGVGRSLIALGVMMATPAEASAAWSSELLAGTSVEVYTPKSTSPTGDGRALMIVLHGCTQQASALRDLGNLEGTAEAMGVVMAVPSVPGGGVVAGCWDYYGPLHTRDNKHNGALIMLAQTLSADPAQDIDPDQVYLVGLSSGAGQALVTGCLAPDVFVGVGAVAGPSVGTSVSQTTSVSTSAAQASAVCTQLGAAHPDDFGTQMGISFADSADFTVATGYNAVNAEALAIALAGGLDQVTTEAVDMAGLAGAMPMGTITLYSDATAPRVARIDSTSGTGHAWPSGSGETGPAPLSFVSGTGLDFARYAAEFFAQNNQRTEGWDPGEETGGAETGSSGGAGESGGDGSGGPTSAGPDGGGGGEGSAGGGGGPGGSGSVTSSGGPAGEDAERVEPSGCQCQHGNPAGASLLVLLLLLGLRRRRAHAAR